MTNRTYLWWLQEMKGKIIMDTRITAWKEPVRGIYGIFVCSEEGEYCAYIGRTNNMYHRFFSSSSKDQGHLTKIKNNSCKNQKIIEALNDTKAIIEMRVLEEVKCQYDDYRKDMQRLAFAEYKRISEYQDKNQCLEQLPDGRNMNEKIWLKQKSEYEK